MDGYVVATGSGAVAGGWMVRRGELWAQDDPVVTQNPQMFTGDPMVAGLVRTSAPQRLSNVPPAAGAVETATAAPGEQRRTRTPRGATTG